MDETGSFRANASRPITQLNLEGSDAEFLKVKFHKITLPFSSSISNSIITVGIRLKEGAS
jgi:hypothetical protein